MHLFFISCEQLQLRHIGEAKTIMINMSKYLPLSKQFNFVAW